MKPLGGFFELEIGAQTPGLHQAASALASGRSCLCQVLEVLRPRRALVPFYTCDALLEPLRSKDVEPVFYSLTPELAPDLVRGPSDDECLIYINYFGMRSSVAAQLAAGYGPRVIIDNTQAFFESGYDGVWSFNSARKFFGVPDGGYLYSPGGACYSYPPNVGVSIDHLVNRLLGRYETAFAQYKENERHITSALLGMSALTASLLGRVDYAAVAARRRSNYAELHSRLGAQNRLPVEIGTDLKPIPFCYPFLPEREVSREPLWASRLFVPTLWPEVTARSGRGFVAERVLAARLLPLPVDHRYGHDDMVRLAQGVAELLR